MKNREPAKRTFHTEGTTETGSACVKWACVAGEKGARAEDLTGREAGAPGLCRALQLLAVLTAIPFPM